eukprot:gene20004-21965_t
MESNSFDEGSGWAEFASFESSEQPPTFQHNKVKSQENLPSQPSEQTASSVSSILESCFQDFGDKKQEISMDEKFHETLERVTEDSDLWQTIHADEERFHQLTWSKSNVRQSLMMILNKFLSESDEECALLPEVLDLTLFIPCFNFHKFARRKNNSALPNRMTEQTDLNRNPASELNPFAPDKEMQELDRCSSDSSLCDLANVRSFDLLSVKEPECSSTTSIESLSGASESNDDTTECNPFINKANNGILEKWRRIQGVRNFNEIMRADFSVAELKSLLAELQQSCKKLSESLVQELRDKDELLRERHVRDDFISNMLAVSRKQKQQEFCQTSKRKKILSHVFGHVETPEHKLLDTAIPYFPTEYGPNLPDIIALTSIIQAILDEDPRVPGMVSNYILNGKLTIRSFAFSLSSKPRAVLPE